jgi:Spy/CpxP family protein refolding chaperone
MPAAFVPPASSFYNLFTARFLAKRVNGNMKTLLPALLLLSTTMFAQRPHDGGPHADMHVATMTTLLSLSSGQQAQATTLFANARTASKGIQTSMHTAQTSLNAAIKSNDIASIETLTAQIGTLHAQNLAIQAKAEAAFRASLTPDQQTKYDTLHHGFGGPGGPGGPRGAMHPPIQ